jgi:hypothetical protein
MKPDQHVTISVGSGVILGILLKSWIGGIACCLIGILIDLDHFLDYWMNRGFNLSLSGFLDFCYHGTSRRFLALLHGYEYIPLYIWISFLPGTGRLGIGLTAGYVLHLLGDQFYNTHLNRWTYFLSYRIYHRFEFSRIVIAGSPSIFR